MNDGAGSGTRDDATQRDDAQQMQGMRVIGLLGQNLLIEPGGLPKASGLMVLHRGGNELLDTVLRHRDDLSNRRLMSAG